MTINGNTWSIADWNDRVTVVLAVAVAVAIIDGPFIATRNHVAVALVVVAVGGADVVVDVAVADVVVVAVGMADGVAITVGDFLAKQEL